MDKFYKTPKKRTRVSVAAFIAMGLQSCQSTQLKFSSDTPDTRLEIFSFTDSDRPEKTLKLPTELSVEDTQNKILSFKAARKLSQSVVFEPIEGDELRYAVKMQDIPLEFTAEKDPNTVPRLVLSAYQAFAKKDYKKMLTATKTIRGVAPRVAAPYILEGLVALERGETSKAQEAFQKAKLLDPRDAAIETLFKATQRAPE